MTIKAEICLGRATVCGQTVKRPTYVSLSAWLGRKLATNFFSVDVDDSQVVLDGQRLTRPAAVTPIEWHAFWGRGGWPLYQQMKFAEDAWRGYRHGRNFKGW